LLEGITMGIINRLEEVMYRRIAHPQASSTFELERAVAEREDVVHASEESPVRFESGQPNSSRCIRGSASQTTSKGDLLIAV
jgi:hypothetical protein